MKIEPDLRLPMAKPLTSWLVPSFSRHNLRLVVSGCCLHISVTKFWDKFASLWQVNSPNSWNKFQIYCTDMYLIRFQAGAGSWSKITSHCLWSLIGQSSLLLVPNMVLSKMNNHEHRTKQTYESYTFQPLMSFCCYTIAFSTNDITNFWSLLWLKTLNLTSVRV